MTTSDDQNHGIEQITNDPNSEVCHLWPFEIRRRPEPDYPYPYHSVKGTGLETRKLG